MLVPDAICEYLDAQRCAGQESRLAVLNAELVALPRFVHWLEDGELKPMAPSTYLSWSQTLQAPRNRMALRLPIEVLAYLDAQANSMLTVPRNRTEAMVSEIEQSPRYQKWKRKQ